MMKNKLIFIFIFFAFIKHLSQNNNYYFNTIINEKDEVNKYYNNLQLDFISDSIHYNKINLDSIKTETKILLCDIIFLFGYNRANTILDVLLTSGDIFYLNNGKRNILYYNIEKLKNVKINDKIQKKYFDTILKKINYEKIISFTKNYLIEYKLENFQPLKLDLSCNLSVSVLRMKYKYIDFNLYAIRREPLDLDCEEYVNYDKYIKKKYKIKQPKNEIDKIYGVYEKNYTFKKVKYIILIDILEVEIMDKDGNFTKIYPEKQ